MTVCALISRKSVCANGLGSAVVSTAAFGVPPNASGRLDVTPNSESIGLKSQSARRQQLEEKATGDDSQRIPFRHLLGFDFITTFGPDICLPLHRFRLLNLGGNSSTLSVVYNMRVPESKEHREPLRQVSNAETSRQTRFLGWTCQQKKS